MSTPTFETYPDSAGEYRWRLTAANGEILGASSEGFSSESEAGKNAWRVISGLTAALGVTHNSATASDWLLEAVYALKDSQPQIWTRIVVVTREVGKYLYGRPDLPAEDRDRLDELFATFPETD